MNESQVFANFLKLATPSERAAYLDEACAGNPQLRADVEALLHVQAQDPDFLEQPVPPFVGTVDAAAEAPGESAGMEQPGVVLAGRYMLLEQIGEGGMGTVWMAQQTEPVKRLVALKLIKAGMDSKQVIARFEAERQALALMDHANIARVLDGGITGAGRPYFVMDLVKGVPITKYCDEHHLTPRQRLELFIPICQAVQHAHQKGIIHRDLKPSNVLVALYDGKPVPKVIDFGVAKAAGHSLTNKTLVTGIGSIVGTLEYMSPEQAEANNQDIDTRSDIYALGVVLYELLTGSTPLTRQRVKEAALLEVLRVIREEEPPKPSTRLSSTEELPSISAQRHTEPAKLTKLVRGELDWIVMKALEKDRSRRYETANGFAMDVQRYLADEPVQACPPSAGYRLRKFARRNKPILLTAALLLVALLLGIVGTAWQAIRATNALDTARDETARANREAGRATDEAKRATILAEQAGTEAAIARAVNDFLDEDLLSNASPFNEPDREIKLRTLVDRATEKINGRFKAQPLVEAAIRQTLGNVHASLGDQRKAEQQYQRTFELRRQHLGPHDAATLCSMTSLATAFNAQGRYIEAEKLHRQVLEIKTHLFGPEVPTTLENLTGLANSSLGQGRPADAEKLHREVYEELRRVQGPEHPHTLTSRTSLALAIKRQGRNTEAEKILRETLETRKRLLRPEHPAILTTMTFLAGAIRDQDCLPEAEELYREVYEIRRRVLGPQHPATLRSMNFLAGVLSRQGRHAEARPLWDESLVHSRQGLAFREAGRLEEAAEAFRQAIAILEPLEEEFPASPEYRKELGRCYLWLCNATNDSQEKEALKRQTLRLWQKLAEDFPKDAWIWSDLGEAHVLQRQWRQAVDAQTKAIALNAQFSIAWNRRAWAHANLHEWNAAIADRTKVLELNPKDWYTRWLRADAYRASKQWDKALADYDQVIESGATSPNVWVGKAIALTQLNQPEQAIAALGQATAKGFRDAKYLQRREDLAALREREDFQKLLTDLEAKK